MMRAACTVAVFAAAVYVAGCGASAPMRAQGGHFSREPDPQPEDTEGKKPVLVLEGFATYYSDKFAGRHTSSGELYDPARRTAASRDLPFGTIVRVTQRETGKSVVVRINDRGPFGDKRRILDLSRAAAADLGILRAGVAKVRAEVLVLGPEKRRR